MSFCDALEILLLDHLNGVTTYNKPTILYIGLSTTTPTDAGGNFTEHSGDGYTRISVTCSTGWTAASGGSSSNVTAITFNEATSSWGHITHFGRFAASSGGVPLDFGELTSHIDVASGNIVRFPAGTLVITLD